MELKSASTDVSPEIAQQHHHQQQQQQQHEKRQEVEQQRFHVLAVDDSLVDRKLLERLLRVSSCQVTCVDSGDKALEYLGLVDNVDKANNNSPPTKGADADSVDDAPSFPDNSSLHHGSKVNLIMTDYCMPGMSGYDLLKRVKGSSWKDVPVVVMSSENVPSRINMCLEGGADEFLLKPLKLSDLEKLQPYLLKSLNDNRPCRNFTHDLDKEDSANVSENDTSNKCTNSVGKRKAVSSEHSERRTKIKGLAVV